MAKTIALCERARPWVGLLKIGKRRIFVVNSKRIPDTWAHYFGVMDRIRDMNQYRRAYGDCRWTHESVRWARTLVKQPLPAD